MAETRTFWVIKAPSGYLDMNTCGAEPRDAWAQSDVGDEDFGKEHGYRAVRVEVREVENG